MSRRDCRVSLNVLSLVSTALVSKTVRRPWVLSAKCAIKRLSVILKIVAFHLGISSS